MTSTFYSTEEKLPKLCSPFSSEIVKSPNGLAKGFFFLIGINFYYQKKIF